MMNRDAPERSCQMGTWRDMMLGESIVGRPAQKSCLWGWGLDRQLQDGKCVEEDGLRLLDGVEDSL